MNTTWAPDAGSKPPVNLRVPDMDSENMMDQGLRLSERNQSLISLLRNRRIGAVDGSKRNDSVARNVKKFLEVPRGMNKMASLKF